MVTLKTFWGLEVALATQKLLKENGIASKLEKLNTNSISQFTNTGVEQYIVMVGEQHLEKSKALIAEDIDQLELMEHPFAALSSEELIEVLIKQDEWDASDIEPAKAILKERGEGVSDSDIEHWQEQRMMKLRKPVVGNPLYTIAGFLFSIVGIYALMGPGIISYVLWVFGPAIGFNYLLHKKRLPDGESVWYYTKTTRRLGLAIVILNVVFVIAGIIIHV